MADQKSKILVIGATGSVGKFIVEASVKEGHPTFVLVRESTISDPIKGKLIEDFRNSGVALLYGDLNDHESLVKAAKQVDVVISTVGISQIADQVKLIAAIKEAGNIKRFLPSEFASDLDYGHDNVVGPLKAISEEKIQIRRLIEAQGIPYTYVASYCFAGFHLPSLAQIQPGGLPSPPRDKVFIWGDGTSKVIFCVEEDIGTYTIKAVDDPRTLNKTLCLRPPNNIYSMNELVALWEKKIGKTLEKTYVTEEEILKNIQEDSIPGNKYLWALVLLVYVKGHLADYKIDPSSGVEASQLYPEVKYTTVEVYLDHCRNDRNKHHIRHLGPTHQTVRKARSRLFTQLTGSIGKFVVEASVKKGHPTFALVRESTISCPIKEKLIEDFRNSGVALLYGDLNDQESLVKAAKQVDVIISTVGTLQVADQVKLIAAIKEAGNIKIFLPSEFCSDVEYCVSNAVGPVKATFEEKIQIQRVIEAQGIPYTYGQVIFCVEEDIGTYTIKAVDVPRTLNKTLCLRPPNNTYSMNELVALWEKKIGNTLEKTYVTEEEILKNIQEDSIPWKKFLWALILLIYVKGDLANYKIDPSPGVEASQLYPDVKYTTVEEYLDQFA
ncbi:NmrA-like domain [Dillenia turbinata]|uniref:NmrA-like domain n=1 Tax=Dillenia turbinata TaxID=194707 RepID=A0AAN8VW23_9MAGN